MSEKEIKAYYERIEKLLNGANKKTYGFAPQEIKNILRSHEILRQENQKLQSQLSYLRNGEYLNQLKFERDMLQDIVDKGEVSKEDKEFIDMTHRNTELLEENEQLKDTINKAKEELYIWGEALFPEFQKKMLKILDNKGEYLV